MHALSLSFNTFYRCIPSVLELRVYEVYLVSFFDKIVYLVSLVSYSQYNEAVGSSQHEIIIAYKLTQYHFVFKTFTSRVPS